MLQNSAENIANILADYENNQMTPKHIIEWVTQFDNDDREFILNELEMIFGKTYVSKKDCIKFLKGVITSLTKSYSYASEKEFLSNTFFLDLQKDEKSQKELLELLKEVLKENYGLSLKDCGKTAKHYLYLDDVLGTGTTVFNNLRDWLNLKNDVDNTISNYEYLKKKDIKLSACFLCFHTWGCNNAEYRLMQEFDDKIKKHVKFFRAYEIENNSKAHNAKLNLMLPVEDQPNEVKAYLNTIEDATKYEDRAFRKSSQPVKEELFSSPENRIRIENIFLKKGIEILKQVKNLNVKQLRPLGYTIKSHKTFGLGTLFFTYRNITNNCPLVFWWASNDWYPLFILKNRGKK